MDTEQLLAEVRRLVGTQVEPLTVSVEDAAKRLGVSPATIRRMLVAGLLRSVRIGKRRMVPMSEVRRLATPSPAVSKVVRELGPPRRKQAKGVAETIRAQTRAR